MAFFGLLLAGVAVPMMLVGPGFGPASRPLGIAGVVLGAVAELSTLTLLTMGAAFTMPIARFGGLIWLIAVSLLLPASRAHRNGVTA